MSRKSWAVLASVLTLAGVTAGCVQVDDREQPRPVPAVDYGMTLRHQVGVDAMMGHLQRLQDIADANGGNRSAGSPGYAASVDYVASVLRDNGFDVQTPEFEFRLFSSDEPSLTVGGTGYEASPLRFTTGTSAEGVSGPLVAAPAEDTPGCTASDYDGLPVAGAVALVDRGTCPFSEKAAAAAERGAVGLVVADNVVAEQMGGTLGEDNALELPVISVSKADGAVLRSRPGPATIKLSVDVQTIKSRNVIAQTKTGSPDNVVVVGGHLDSVEAGPGINDNGSGVAAVLETAVQMGSSPPVQHAVRFAFWGAEEIGLVGSSRYVANLDDDALKDIALYLNFDMIGSPNPGYFTFDGDQSMPPSQTGVEPRVPEGAAGIERTLVEYLDNAGKVAGDAALGVGRSDYDAFTRAGIPSGGLFSGAGEDKTVEQARWWGGEADEPFDPNYHQAADTIDNIDRTALGIHGGGVAYATGRYAQDLSGRNGVPLREDRTRHQLSQ